MIGQGQSVRPILIKIGRRELMPRTAMKINHAPSARPIRTKIGTIGLVKSVHPILINDQLILDKHLMHRLRQMRRKPTGRNATIHAETTGIITETEDQIMIAALHRNQQNNKSGKVKAYLALVFAIILASCGNNSIVEEKFTLEDGSWPINKAYFCNFNIVDTVNPHNFFLNVRNTASYPYSNLYVFVSTTLPNGKVAIDTVECVLADPSGRWTGSGLGDVLDNHVLFRYNKRFPMSGTYKMSLQHAMRDSVVPAILNLGISIEKAN